jgi:glycosyltransferase involved in cell wall biosynthesis
MKKLNTILPQPIYEYKENYYLRLGQPEFFNKFSKYFNIHIFGKVVKVNQINSDTHIRLEENITPHDFFKEITLTHVLSNFKYYKKLILHDCDIQNDLFFLFYPYYKVSVVFAFMLRKTKLAIWFKSDYVARFTLQKDSLKRILAYLLKPFVYVSYTLITRYILKDNLVFYSGDILYNKNNHINQHAIISCSDFNNNPDILSNERSKKIIFVGNESEYKGLIYLLKALDKIENPPKLTIVGIDKLERYKKYSHLNIECVGEIRERKIFYKTLAEHDCLIMPSRQETQGKVQLEAMSVGVVPICSDSGGTHNTIQNFYNGLLFKERSIDDLVDKINHIYRDKDFYSVLQINGLNYMKVITLDRQVGMMKDTIINHHRYN